MIYVAREIECERDCKNGENDICHRLIAKNQTLVSFNFFRVNY